MTKNIKFVITRLVFFKLKCTKIRLRPALCPGPRWGSLRRSPKTPSRLGFPSPLDAFGVSNTAPLFSGPLSAKS